jgi:hypothetical protein
MRFANFYRRFIKDYSGIAISFINLIRKDRPFTWIKNEQLVFEELKRRFLKTFILTVFNPELPIVLKTDVSDYAIEACIMQLKKERKFHLFAFYFRKILPAELNYDIYDKELLTIVAAFQEWRVYLKGSKY